MQKFFPHTFQQNAVENFLKTAKKTLDIFVYIMYYNTRL